MPVDPELFTAQEWDFLVRFVTLMDAGKPTARAFDLLPPAARPTWRRVIRYLLFFDAVFPAELPGSEKLRAIAAQRPAEPVQTRRRPTGHGRNGATAEHAAEIQRRHFAGGETVTELAEAFGCSRTTVTRILAKVSPEGAEQIRSREAAKRQHPGRAA